jgi:hypothetical protein
VQLTGSPAGPWDVATVDGDQRVAAEGSTLAATLAAGGTTISLASTATNGIWTTNAADYPLPVRVGGELVTVGAVGQVLNANPFRLVLSDWATVSATIALSTTYLLDPAYDTIRVTPPGGASPELRTAALVPATAGTTYRFGIWVYSPAGWPTGIRVGVNWHVAAGGFLSNAFGTTVAIAAGAWTYLVVDATAPATTGQARLIANQVGTPAAGVVWYAAVPTIAPVASITASPQTMTVVPGGRTLARSWPAGTPVDVADPAIVPL